MPEAAPGTADRLRTGWLLADWLPEDWGDAQMPAGRRLMNVKRAG